MTINYIDKTELLRKIDENKLMAREPAAKRIREIIQNMTVFAGDEPVKHGWWVNFYNDFSVAECSECEEMFEVAFEGETCGALWDGFKRTYKYCPHCGARMDG